MFAALHLPPDKPPSLWYVNCRSFFSEIAYTGLFIKEVSNDDDGYLPTHPINQQCLTDITDFNVVRQM